MKTRLELQTKLEELFGSRNVYYQPPENLSMNYPAIVYSKNDIDKEYADNLGYINTNSYRITIIDKKPDNPIIKKLLDLPYSSYDRNYVKDNLNHDVIILYF